MLCLSLLPGSHYEKFKQLTYIATGLEVLDDEPIFSDIARSQKSFVCKHRQTEGAKTKL